MKVILLKVHIVSFFLLLFSFVAAAQNFRYIYIQTEDQKPFYIKMGEQTMSSSSSGYIIIPRLIEGSYKIKIGFPKSTLPELLVTVALSDADLGYLLRNDVDQGLYMVDLQTKKFVATETQWPQPKNTVQSKDEFARILSEVVNDSTIAEIPVLKNAGTKVFKTEVSKIPGDSVPVGAVAVIKNKSVLGIDNVIRVLKLDQNNTAEGLSARYVDGADTVNVFISVAKTLSQAVIEQKPKDALPVKKDAVAANNTSSKCKSTATQKDFLDIRKKMAAQKTETAMQKIVVAELNKTCFTTEQIKSLGSLFTTEPERYKFYVSAFPHVSDEANFVTLQNQLADNYYITRFKAMLNH